MHILVTNAPGMGYSATVVRGAPTGDMLNEYVGGWFDAVNCWGRVEGRRVDMWVHDEGLLMGLRPTIVVEYGQERWHQCATTGREHRGHGNRSRWRYSTDAQRGG